MIAKYLFFLILFMVILIHVLQPWPRLDAAAPFMSDGGQRKVCMRVLHQGECSITSQ